MTRTIKIPEMSLVVVIGASGSGKSTFARKHFKPTEIVSSDACRGLVADDENDQSATKDAFDVLHFIARKRLEAGKITVVDATNVQPEARKPLVALAREQHVLPVAIVLDVDPKLCHERNAQRPDRSFGRHVVRQQTSDLRRSIRHLDREGFRNITVLGEDEIDDVQIIREPLWNNKRGERGPFDIIGDIHGCYDELVALLAKLGWQGTRHPEGRKAIFVGDLVDRGPRSPDVLRLVMQMVAEGTALCVPGNHEMKFLKKLRGKDVRLTHGLKETVEQFEQEPPEFHAQVAEFIDELVSHYVLDDGKLVVAHAGLKEKFQGRGSGAVREFCLYGETTGETDEYGLPVRYAWANDYRGRAMVVYGHTPVPEAEWINGTICIDTGCVFGGALTALRYPERQLVSVPAAKMYFEPTKPFAGTQAGFEKANERRDAILDISDVAGKRIIQTRLQRTVTIREENSAAALEVMSRFAVDPRWLIYLPPTMSPSDTCADGDLLEHPREAIAYFRHQGVPRVIMEEKHMGSRAVIVVCRDVDTARKRFRVEDGSVGAIYTRTGRPFFDDTEMLTRISRALDWNELGSDWACLDVEIMPWSAKAQSLLQRQYAAVGSVGTAAVDEAWRALARADVDGIEDLRARFARRRHEIAGFVAAYGRYCWPVASLDDYRIAPFHLLASEGRVNTDRDHLWHMEIGAKLAARDPMFVPTKHVVVDVLDVDSEAAAIRWWEELTAAGGEGAVIKPIDFLTTTEKGLVQPACKVRGREYLRIIYGPEYTAPENLARLRARALGAKRSLAIRELALGLEALHRFVDREPLHRVHECVFGVLALESEPVDPRL